MDTYSSFQVSIQEAGKGISTRYNIASSGIKAAMMASEVSKAHKKLELSKASGIL
jgi:hypothetical protein